MGGLGGRERKRPRTFEGGAAEGAQAGADDGLDAQGLDVLRVLAHELAQLHPQLVARLAFCGHDVLLVEHLGELRVPLQTLRKLNAGNASVAITWATIYQFQKNT